MIATTRSPITILLAMAVGAGLAWLCGRPVERPNQALPAVVLTEILGHVQSQYVDQLTEAEIRDLAHTGFDRMLRELDRHSGYIVPRRVEAFEEDTEGYFVGIGVVLAPPESADHYPRLSAVVHGGPAEKAGLLADDLIQRVEEEDVRGLEIANLKKRIKGDPGSHVVLTILRGDDQDPRQYSVVRKRVETSSLTGVRLYEPQVGAAVGYIRLDQFQQRSGEEVREATRNLVASGASSVILDLRDNGGGILSQAREVASIFLADEALIVTTRGRNDPTNVEEIRVVEAGPFPELPLIILLDGGSASASELISAALRDHGRAVIVGEESFGKWSVQNIISLGANGEDGRLKLTTKSFHPPVSEVRRDERGQTLGLVPDLEVVLDPGTLQQLRREWHEERLSRVNDPRGVDSREIPRYEPTSPSEPDDKRHADAVLIRAIAVFTQDDYATLLAESQAQISRAATPGDGSSADEASVPATVPDDADARRP